MKLSKTEKMAQLVPWMSPYKMGYTPWMFCDQRRNRFYDRILRACRNKVCAEVGFGTGILSFIACHRGAKHVYSFEREKSTYELGKYIIEDIGLKDRVTLIHGDPLLDGPVNDYYKSLNVDITLHELINRNLWGESLKELADFGQGKILPEKMECIINFSKDPEPYIMQRDPLNLTGLKYLDETLSKSINKFISNDEYIPYDGIEKSAEVFQKDGVLGSYKFLIGNDVVPDIISVDIDVPEDDCIIWCEYFIDGFKVTDGHWRFDKVIRKKTKGKFQYKTATIDGNWWIE